RVELKVNIFVSTTEDNSEDDPEVDSEDDLFIEDVQNHHYLSL
ncbi:1864_t:CDS:2, partial [Scutellospora calospora]